MKKILSTAIGLLVSLFSIAQSPDALNVKTFTLSNGMEVWINEDHSQPKAFGAVVVKAGARDCPATGIAHYFEHIMFKGTDKIGTIDYAAEKPYLDSIAVLYDELAVAPDSLKKGIQMEINRLNIKASEYAIPNEYNNLITKCGGSDLNAYTSHDVTVYHNQFVSAYFEQWAELNSERLINPVFRMFQSELETVYEEKNRADNNEMKAFSELLLSKGFQGSPYAYPIIGTTENLKNPQLSLMQKFFNDYYVAGNMGLMLTGDINPETALPILEKTFGRIRSGEVPAKENVTLTPYDGREEVVAMAKIPIVKMTSMCYRAPSNREMESIPLTLLSFMLNNSEGTGMLDKLTTDKKLLAAICLYSDMSFNDAGLFSILILPKLLFQRNKKAETIVKAVLEDVKTGNFDEDFLASCKYTLRKQLLSNLETIEDRMNSMVESYKQGFTWEEYLAQIEALEKIGKDDIVAIANKYLTDDYLVVTKKFGDSSTGSLEKPPYKKIAPKNGGENSAYAQGIIASCSDIQLPKAIVDFENASAQSHPVQNVTVYSTKNEINDVFELKISFPVGTYDYPALDRLAQYMGLSGTESMNYDEHRSALQKVGGSIGINATTQTFSISVSGFDDKFEETLKLASDLLYHPKGEKKHLSTIRQSELASKLTESKNPSSLSYKLFGYVLYRDESPYLKDKGKLDDSTLMGVLDEVLQHGFDVHYSGGLGHDELLAQLGSSLEYSRAVKEHPYYSVLVPKLDNSPKVYFINKKKATQTIIRAIVPGEVMSDLKTRFISYISNQCFGGGSMGSILFQEIREFRSLSYSPYSSYVKPSYCKTNEFPGYLSASVSTQGDKTEETMAVIDSLVNNAVFNDERVGNAAKNIWCQYITDYPTFRGISTYISDERHSGYDEDSNNYFYPILETVNKNDIQSFWKDYVVGRNIIWVIVGDSEKIDMDALKSHGEFVELKAKNVAR